MKKFLRLLLTNVETVVLIVFLLLFIIALTGQIMSLGTTRGKISELETMDLSSSGKQVIEPIDESQFAIRVDVDEARIWQRPYTTGTWEDMLDPENEYILPRMTQHLNQYYPTSDALEASSRFEMIIEDQGAGTLVDPPLYVISKGSAKELLGFTTLYSIGAGRALDIVPDEENRVSRETVPGDDDDDDDDPSKRLPTVPEPWSLLEKLRWTRRVPHRLPIQLKSVMPGDPEDKDKWHVTIQAAGETVVLKRGQNIPRTNYKLEDVDRTERVEKIPGSENATRKKEIYSITVRRADGTGRDVKLTKGARPPIDPNTPPAYEMVFFRRPDRKKVFKVGDMVPVKDPVTDQSADFRVWDATDEAPVVVKMEGNQEVGNPTPVQKYTETSFREWQAHDRKRRELKERRKRLQQDRERNEGRSTPRRAPRRPARRGPPRGEPDVEGPYLPPEPM